MESTLRALADTTRLRILALLVTGEVCVCHIHESLGIPQPKASRHLAYLKRTGLVEARKEGLWVYYRLASSLDPLAQTVLSTVIHCLGHLAATNRDRQRLVKRTGCCLLGDVSPRTACCEPGH